MAMTLPLTALLTSTFTSGWTLPTSVTLTWMSPTSVLPTLTDSFGSCLLLAFAFMATKTPATAKATTMMDTVANFRLRLDELIPTHPLFADAYNGGAGKRLQSELRVASCELREGVGLATSNPQPATRNPQLRSHPRQLLLRIALRIDLRIRLGDFSVLVDDVGDAFGVLVLRLGGRAVGEPDLAVGVAQQGEVELELFGEAAVGVDVVEAAAEDLDVLCGELVAEVPEPGTFQRSAGCVGLGIEPEQDLAAAVVGELPRAAGVVLHFEIRRGVARLEHLASSSEDISQFSCQGHERAY